MQNQRFVWCTSSVPPRFAMNIGCIEAMTAAYESALIDLKLAATISYD
jgi:hypothetical protein